MSDEDHDHSNIDHRQCLAQALIETGAVVVLHRVRQHCVLVVLPGRDEIEDDDAEVVWAELAAMLDTAAASARQALRVALNKSKAGLS